MQAVDEIVTNHCQPPWLPFSLPKVIHADRFLRVAFSGNRVTNAVLIPVVNTFRF
jgi:hypothetical protein